MPSATLPPDPTSRRRVLALFVNTAVALIGGGLSAVLGAFALKGGRDGTGHRWLRVAATSDLRPGVPVPRVIAVPRQDGWYRARGRETVFLVWDGAGSVRAMSATCTHLGCQVRWEAETKRFLCPCHGGVYDASGSVVSGPPPRPLDTLETRIDPSDASVLVRL